MTASAFTSRDADGRMPMLLSQLNEGSAGLVSSGGQRFPEHSDSHVDAVVKVHNRAAGPEGRPDLFAGHHLAGVLNQHSQDPEGLFSEKGFAVSVGHGT
jgi:hypothetical protein